MEPRIFPFWVSLFLYPLFACEACILSFMVAQLHERGTENTPIRPNSKLVANVPQEGEYVSLSPQNETTEGT